jgi:zinc protease
VALDEALDLLGASLRSESFEDYSALTLTAPAEHLERLVELLAELVIEPRFETPEIKGARARARAALAHQWYDPPSLADHALRRAVFGMHPYANPSSGSAYSARRFTRMAVARLHRTRMGPRNATLYIVGAVKPAHAQRFVLRAFSGWRSEAMPPAPVPRAVGIAHAGETWIIDKPETTQVQLRLGFTAPARGSEDTFAGELFNAALGGGYSALLVQELRIRRALAYRIGSWLDPLRSGGFFAVTTATQVASTGELAARLLLLLRKAARGGLSVPELDRAKRYLAGTYPLRWETLEATAALLGELDIYGLDCSWVEEYRESILSVSAAQVRSAMERCLGSEPPAVVLAGPARAVRPQVKGKLGNIRSRSMWKLAKL